VTSRVVCKIGEYVKSSAATKPKLVLVLVLVLSFGFGFGLGFGRKLSFGFGFENQNSAKDYFFDKLGKILKNFMSFSLILRFPSCD
jgi:hypothetical protein